MIIALLNQKGGVGKTTLALHVAAGLALSGARVLVVDADPQGSARDWAAVRQAKPLFPVIALDRPTLHRDLPAVARDYAHVVIDGPPRSTELTRSAILAAERVLIPVQPSALDVWAGAEIVRLVGEAAAFKAGLSAAFVVNRKVVNTALGRDVDEALARYALPVCVSHIHQRIAFAEAMALGTTVCERAPSSTAAREIAAFVQEMLDA